MTARPALKVYGHIWPAQAELESELDCALATAIQDDISDDVPLLCRDGDMLRISFEGAWFPEDAVLDAFKRHLTPGQQGKMDVLDMDAWRMTRHVFKDGAIRSSSAPLNNVLDYSGF